MAVAGEERRRWIEPQDLADEWGVTTWFINELVRTGKLRAYRLGPRITRFRPEDVDAFLEASIVDPAEAAATPE